MRLLSLVVAAVIFLTPLAVLAQHSPAPAPAPAHVTSIASHTWSAPSVGAHSSSIATSRSTGATAHPGAQGSRPAKASHELTGTNSRPERASFFSFRHKSKPDRCRNGSCATATPSRSLTSPVPAVTPVASEARRGCTLVAVPNSGIPCNMLSPCCP
jgi:hypothetical protein